VTRIDLDAGAAPIERHQQARARIEPRVTAGVAVRLLSCWRVRIAAEEQRRSELRHEDQGESSPGTAVVNPTACMNE
jgi:hypothetical protein